MPIRRVGRVNTPIVRRNQVIRTSMVIKAASIVTIGAASYYKYQNQNYPIYIINNQYVIEDPHDESAYIQINIQ